MAIATPIPFTRREVRTLAVTLFDGCSDAEAARLHGITAAAVKMRRYRARLKARQHGVEIPSPRRARVKLRLRGLPQQAA